MGPLTTYPMTKKESHTIKKVYFSVSSKRLKVEPIILYGIDPHKSLTVPDDSVFAMNFKSIDVLNLMIDNGGFHYYWGHLGKDNIDKFVGDMNDLGIIVKREKK